MGKENYPGERGREISIYTARNFFVDEMLDFWHQKNHTKQKKNVIYNNKHNKSSGEASKGGKTGTVLQAL